MEMKRLYSIGRHGHAQCVKRKLCLGKWCSGGMVQSYAKLCVLKVIEEKRIGQKEKGWIITLPPY